MQIAMKDTAKLSVSKMNPRAGEAPNDIDGLVQSIETVGLLVPLVVRGDEVLDGRRRLAAAAKAGLRQVPTMEAPSIENDGDSDREIALVANMARQQLGPRQVAQAARKIMLSLGFTPAELLEAVQRRAVRSRLVGHALIQAAGHALGILPADVVGYSVVGDLDPAWWAALAEGHVDLETMQLATALDAKAQKAMLGEARRYELRKDDVVAALSGARRGEAVDLQHAAFESLDGLETLEIGGLFGKEGGARVLTRPSAQLFLKRQAEALKALRKELDDKSFATVDHTRDSSDPTHAHINRHELVGAEQIVAGNRAKVVADLRAGKVHGRDRWSSAKTGVQPFDPKRSTILLGLGASGQLMAAVWQPPQRQRVVDPKTGKTQVAAVTQLTGGQHAEVIQQLGAILIDAVETDQEPFYRWAAAMAMSDDHWAGDDIIGGGGEGLYGLREMIEPRLTESAKQKTIDPAGHHRAIVALRLPSVQQIGAGHPSVGLLPEARALLGLYDIDVRTHFRPNDEWLSALSKADLVAAIRSALKLKKLGPNETAKKDFLVADLRKQIGDR
ncbi:MAG: ParB/RepB/Spo0J family partition protein, partial [Alphaproteobacteria bacterium]